MHISSISMDHRSNRDQSEGHNDQQHFSYQQQPAAAGRGTYPITSSSPSSSAPFSTEFLGHDFLSPSCPNPDWFSTQASAEDNPCLYNFMEVIKNNDDEVRRRREHQQQSSLSYYSSDQSSHDSQTLAIERIQKEHMFDKVVTPSDVGKLNRLVIPKQHAERYFPLDSSANEKGLLLNFEDSTRKLWRFRYSYWNSSQSYVMTKGWSRFVKEKKLEAGDTVSFQRGVGEASRDRLFIDWRRRPTSNNPLLFHHEPGSIIPSLSLPYHYFPFNQTRPATWGTTSTATPPLYLQPLVQLTSTGHHFPQHNYSNLHFHSKSHHYNQYQQQQLQQCSPYTNNNNGVISDPYRAAAVGSSSHTVWYLRSSADESPAGGYNGEDSMVFDSVPVVHHPKAEGKKLRLFGVSMECENQPNTLAESETLSSSPTPGAASSRSESPHFRSDNIFSDPSERRSKGIISLNLSF